MLKAGAVYAKRFSEWFQPLNTNHVSAYLAWKVTGRWPKDFIPDTVWFPGGWEEEIQKMVANMPVPEGVQAFTSELKRVSDIVGTISFPGYEFLVDTLADHFYIRVKYQEPDIATGVNEDQLGRIWAFPAGQTEDQIVQTCFLACLTSYEHRAREHFTYQGVPVMYPHRNMAEVVAMMQQHMSMLMVVGASPRSSKWPKVRDEHLEKFPTCIACGAGKPKPLNVHHVKPYHLFPDLELEPTNLVTLCESPSHNCHFIFGHFLNWSHCNPRVREMAAEYLKGLQESKE